MGALTRIVDDLQKKQLVNRERSEHDRRAVHIALTPEGRRLAFSVKAAVVILANKLVEPYTKAETDTLISLLQRLLQHMEGVAKQKAWGVEGAEASGGETTGAETNVGAQAKVPKGRRAAGRGAPRGPRKAQRGAQRGGRKSVP
jgi:hypothetical protein